MIDSARIRAQQRGQNANRGGLAGPVGSEHAEHAAAGDREVDPAERMHLAEGLVQRRDLDGVIGAGDCHGRTRIGQEGRTAT